MKLRKGKNTEIELGGQESFLDLVSNIVGILIILVMVAGIRAQYSSAEVAPEQAFADAAMLVQLETQYQELQTKAEHAANLRVNIEELEIQSEIIAEQVYLQSMEYAALFDLMTSVRAEIELAAEAKSQALKDKIECQRRLMEIQAKLEQIDQAKNHLQQIRPKATVLENTPTSLSQMVETKEIHVRLLGGRVVYVPLDEFTSQLRGHVGAEQHRYAKQPTHAGKIGPIDHFEMEYILATRHIPVPGGIETRIGLQYGEIVPMYEPLGQPLHQALASPQSEFCRKLAAFQKHLYTVTVWVYPDSFEEYQELKQFLQVQGYSVAARPMLLGHPIGISPHGTRSSTQ
ncbi:MAG: hypothetical protein FWG73_04620 [Planctomycetaceae bacterium]|nr:hypothetical protein [Planctomycetaceae bacterium]